MLGYVVVAVVGAAVTYVLTPGVRVFAVKIGAIDIPRDRKIHHAPTPLLGGIAIYIGLLASLGTAALMPQFRGAFRFSEIIGLTVGGLGVLLVGALDDWRELQAPPRAAAEILLAGFLFLSGVKMSYFWLPWIGVLSLSPDLSAILTIAWVFLLINAVNFLDGLDGLAAGLTMIAAGAFGVYSLILKSEGLLGFHPLAPIVAAALFGVCAGFLRHNFNPARIFMGDSGAYVLGFMLAGATISAIGQTTTPGPEGGRLALPLVFTPIVFLALPITDFVLAVVRRIRTGRVAYHPDKEHLHHRLLDFGHSQRQAVLVLYGWALTLAGGLVVSGLISWGRFLLLFAVAIGTLAMVTFAPRFRTGATPGPRLPVAETVSAPTDG